MSLHMYLLAVLQVVQVVLLLGVAEGAGTKVYSFRGAKSSPDGLEHGARGLACLRELLDPQVLIQHLTAATSTAARVQQEEYTYTDEHLAAAIYMAYGEPGIDRICNLDVLNQQRRRNLRDFHTKQQHHQQQHLQQQQHRSLHDATEQSCISSPNDAEYPSDTAGSVYMEYAMSRDIDVLLPDGTTYMSRTDPKKTIQQAQVVLDDSLEAEYNGLLCQSYFKAVTNVISIVDFVIIKQGSILDGINGFTCGLGQGLARATQTRMRGIVADAVKHDHLINQAEAQATYKNTAVFTTSMCSWMHELQTLGDEIDAVKKQFNTTSTSTTTASPTTLSTVTTRPPTGSPTTLPPVTR
jgi:hypothetical protein